MGLTKITNAVSSLPNDNYIINGQFEIWQRGTGSFTGTEYTADRWIQSFQGGTVSSMAVGTFDRPSWQWSRYANYVNFSGQNASSNWMMFNQRIEDCRRFAGKILTLSLDLWSSITGYVTLRLNNVYGSGGSASEYVVAPKVAITASQWNHIEVTFTNVSQSGKTISDTDSYLSVDVVLSAGSDYNAVTDSLGLQNGSFYMTNFKLEDGTVATPLSPRPLQQELSLCQRYYYNIAGTEPIGIGCGMSTYMRVERFHPVVMRTVPTVTSTFSTNIRAYGNGTCSLYTTYQNDTMGCIMVFTPADFSATNNNAYILDTQSSSGRLNFDAEL